MNDFVMIAITAVVAFVLGVLACILIHRQKAKNDQRKIADAEAEALRIVNEAIKNAESKKREALVETKEEIYKALGAGAAAISTGCPPAAHWAAGCATWCRRAGSSCTPPSRSPERVLGSARRG